MNRRTFFTSTAASVVLINSSRSASAQSKKPVTSKLSDADIDFGETNFEFGDHKVEVSGRNQIETISLHNDYAALTIQFIDWRPRPDIDEQYGILTDQLEQDPDTSAIEKIGVNKLSDGAWMAYSHQYLDLNVSTYWEVQFDAFPDKGIDLWIELRVFGDEVAAALQDVQNISLAGMPPLLFTDESRVGDGLFEQSQDDLSASGLSSRLQTSTSGSSDTASTSSGDVVEDVREHQERFHDELDELFAALEVASDAPTDAEEMDAMAIVMEIGNSWSIYPTDATALEFPSDLDSLESAYMDFADAVGVLGDTLLTTLLGTSDIDDFTSALDAANAFDTRLSAELRNLGIFPDSRTWVINRTSLAELAKRPIG